MRQAGIQAYSETTYYLFVPALGISFIPLIAACLQSNYFLGDQQNKVEFSSENDSDENVEKPSNWRDKIVLFYSQPLSGSKIVN